MDGVRVKLLLVVLAGKLLLTSAWKPVDENKLRSFYEMGGWVDPQHVSLEGKALVKSFLLQINLNIGVPVKM